MSETVLAPIDSLIVVKQLPVIEEQLKDIRANIEAKVAGVLALDCNEGTVKAIKVLRSDLNKDFAALEERRKYVKNKVMAPYESFEAIYKECVSDIFKETDKELKRRISEVESSLKVEKTAEIEAYFEEYRKSKGIDFIFFHDAGINVTLSASKKSLKEAVRAFVDRVCDDLALIDTQEHKAEILVEYKKTLNVSAAVTTVSARQKAVAMEAANIEKMEQDAQERHAAASKVLEAAQEANAPLAAPTTEEIYELTFTVRASKEKMVALKQFIVNDGGYEIVK